MIDEFMFMWRYGPYLVGFIGVLTVLVLLRCLLAGICCCSCCGGSGGSGGSDVVDVGRAPAQVHAVGHLTSIRPVVVADQFICSISAVVIALLPVAVYFAAVEIWRDYDYHYEECQRDQHAEWEEAFDFYCRWCKLNIEHGLTKKTCDTSLSVLKFSKHFPRDDVCHRDSAISDLTHHYRTCAIRGVLSHIPHWTTSDDPSSYQSVMMIQTISSSINYAFIIVLVIGAIVGILVCKATPSMMQQAVNAYKTTRDYRVAVAKRVSAEEEMDQSMNRIKSEYRESAQTRLITPPPVANVYGRRDTGFSQPLEFPPTTTETSAASLNWFGEGTPLQITEPDPEPHNPLRIQRT